MTMRALRYKFFRYSCMLVCLYPLTMSHAAYKTSNAEPLQHSENITLDFKKIPVRELVQFIADAMNYNVIMSENVSGNLSLHFHNMTWQQSLDAILEMSGLVKKQKDNLLF